MVRSARQALQERQQQELASWAQSFATAADRRERSPDAGNENLGAALGVAAAEFSSLQQAGVTSDAGKVIAIIGTDDATARFAPDPPAALEGSTVVVDNFPGDSDEESGWQASPGAGGRRAGGSAHAGH